jgi:hypothetical protein
MVRDDSPVGRGKNLVDLSNSNQNSAFKLIDEDKEIKDNNLKNDIDKKGEEENSDVILEKRPSINMAEIHNDFDELEKMINTSHLSLVNESYEFIKKDHPD